MIRSRRKRARVQRRQRLEHERAARRALWANVTYEETPGLTLLEVLHAERVDIPFPRSRS